MNPQELLPAYLNSTKVMQLASCKDGKPYVVNVHYYADKTGNLYWISLRDTRHSREFAANPNACAVIKVHENTPAETWIIGLSVEGTVEYLGNHPEESIFAGYLEKHDSSHRFIEAIKSGENKQLGFYRLKPQHFSLFDTKNFPKNPKQEWSTK